MTKKKKYYLDLIDRIDRGKWNAELRIKVVKQIREGIRREFDKISDTIKGIDDEIQKIKDEKPENIKKQLKELFDVKHKYELDADKMKEQMMGKWIELEECYHGGLDEEVKNIESDIAGGEEFKKIVEQELKKI